MRRIIVTSIGVAFALTLGGATRASAQPCTAPNIGPFSIDGCVSGSVATGSNSKLLGDAAAVIDPAGSAKEIGPINASTTKLGVINSAPVPMLGPTNPNAQVDLNTVYTQTGVDSSNGHIWYYFGWIRDSNNGSGVISIELQKSKVPDTCTGTNGYAAANCNPWSNRSTGDILIVWDQQGGGTNIGIRTYNSATQSFGVTVPLTASQAKAVYGTDLFRGELAIDFTAVVFGTGTECKSFANTIPGTVTGNSDTADYKDVVLAAFPPVSNCGSVTITKATVPAGQAGTFAYTLGRSPAGDIFDGTVDDDCTDATDKQECAGTLTAGQTDTITDLLAQSTLTLTEDLLNMPAGFVLDSIVCSLDGTDYTVTSGGTFPVVATKTTACVITNRLNTGTLIVKKVVVNDNGLTLGRSDFSYKIDTGIQAQIAFVDDNVGATYTLTAGTTYNVLETPVPGGYTVSYSTDCTNGTIVAGQTKTCTVTNNDTPGQPAQITTQSAILHDSASVSGLRAGGTAMTVDFKLYNSLDNCRANGATGLIGANLARPLTISGTTGTASTNTGVTVTLPGAGTGTATFFWRVTSAGNANNAPWPAGEACGESVTITFAGS
jgi:hypothetical protein